MYNSDSPKSFSCIVVAQVWWAPLKPADMPADIVKKYAGKGMAVVGWEIDQVRKGAGPNGEDVPVPISASYNRA